LVLCRILAVSRSGFYRWTVNEPARQARAVSEDALAEQGTIIHVDSGGTHGSPRVTVELRERATANGWSGSCGSGRSWAGTYAGANGRPSRIRPRRRHRICSAGTSPLPHPTSDGAATSPTYPPAAVGSTWLPVIDITTRCLIGWSINTYMCTSLVVNALDAAVADDQHGPKART
jgi:transposase InsO family protein